MNNPSKVFLFALTCGSVLFTSLQANEVHEALTERQRQIRQKIVSLYGQRDQPFPALKASMNPFFRTEDETEATLDENFDPAELMPVLETATGDELLLENLAKTIQINGVVKFNGKDLIVINQFPTPVGSMVAVEIGDTTRFIRVEEIGFGQVTISLGEARMTLPY